MGERYRPESATRAFRCASCAALCVLSAFVWPPRRAAADTVQVPAAEQLETSRAFTYVHLSGEDALSEIRRRRLPFEPETKPVPGVRTPGRLKGPLHGVWIHSSLPAAERSSTPFEILDARLALALDDFARVLEKHDIVEVVHFTIYRAPDGNPEAEEQHRHPAGLAIDVGAFRKRGGATLTVALDWPAAINATTCGRRGRKLPNRAGRELVSLACELKDLRLFNVVLTPHFNHAHHDHLHLEITPGARWFSVR